MGPLFNGTRLGKKKFKKLLIMGNKIPYSFTGMKMGKKRMKGFIKMKCLKEN